MNTPENLLWKVHTPNLLQEIAKGSGQAIYRIPLSILQGLLAQVAQRAVELNDPKMNALMCRLTLYAQSDPDDSAYNPDIVEETLKQGAPHG